MCYNVEVVEEKLNNLRSLVDKYQRNLQGVSCEERNGRYKNAFAKLRKEILYAVADYAFANACSVYIPEGSKLYNEAAYLVNKALPGIMNVLWKGGNIEGIIEEIRLDFLDNYYFPSMMSAAVAS